MAHEDADDRPEAQQLFANLRSALPGLERLLDKASSHWASEDGVYRFYHQSFKVFGLQTTTSAIVSALQALAPARPLNEWFMQIVRDGTGKTFEREYNKRWLEVTRPIVEAFFHARYFLEMVCKYARELDAPPAVMPSGWAAVLHFYGLR